MPTGHEKNETVEIRDRRALLNMKWNQRKKKMSILINQEIFKNPKKKKKRRVD